MTERFTPAGSLPVINTFSYQDIFHVQGHICLDIKTVRFICNEERLEVEGRREQLNIVASIIVPHSTHSQDIWELKKGNIYMLIIFLFI